MIKKSKVILLAAVLVLAFAQVAFPALRAVGPVIPDADGNPLTAPWAPPFALGAPTGFNGFPVWYRDSLGQTVILAPQDPLTIWDPVINGNAFSAQIQWGSEAMYWTGDASIPTPLGGDPVGGSADLIMALEAAFATGDAAPGEQIVFARIRIRIDTDIAGPYTVYHPYGVNTFTVDQANTGTRAINSTVDVGIGAQGVFTGALKGDIGPFLRQVNGAPAGYLGDGTFGPVTGSPVPSLLHPSGFQNFFRVEGPPGFATLHTTDIAVTGKLFTGVPFTISRTTFTRAANNFAEVFVNLTTPIPAGVAFTANLPGQAPQPLSRVGANVFGRFQFPNALPAQVTVTGTATGKTPTSQQSNLVDVIIINQATYSVANRTLTIAATSTDSLAALRGFGWVGATAAGQQLAGPAGQLGVFNNVNVAPETITVKSALGGSESVKTVILP
jgi:hypothetical protein